LNGYSFYSGMDEYSKSVSGYYLDYKETSEIKIIPKSYIINKTKFPKNDEIFEFETSGMIGINAELSYNSQEESCVITHGIKMEEKINEKDKFQEMGIFYHHTSPILTEKLNESGTFSFPTKQVQRKNKIISGENKFIKVNQFSPNYYNHFYLNVIPEYAKYSDESSLLKTPVQDAKLFPLASIISSSSYDYKEEYIDGSFFKMEKIDRDYEVTKSVRFYDSLFCNSLINSGFGFVENLPIGLILNSNGQNKTFLTANNQTISEIEMDKTHGKEVSDRGF
jgi:hypothetical protein